MDLRGTLAQAGRDLRRAWGVRAWVVVAAVAVAATAPAVVSDPVRLGAMAAALYIALAAVGLNFAVGLAGMPSLGQGGFVGIGAFTAALLRVKAGWDPAAAALAATALAALAGAVVGAGAVRLPGAFVAVATWIFSWTVAVALAAFPAISGGSQGLAIPQATEALPLAGGSFRLSSGVHFEIGLALLGLALLAFMSLSRGPVGLATAAVRQGPSAALALGIDGRRLRFGLFVASAVLAGLAGSLLVQLEGVADPTAFGPLLSIELFVAVLLGGAGMTLGPLLGASVLVIVPRVSRIIGSLAGRGPERYQSVIAAALLLVALVLGRGGVARLLIGLRDRVWGRTAPDRKGSGALRSASVLEAVAGGKAALADEPVLEAKDLEKRFGGVIALDQVSLALRPGKIHGLIGPNGSGKTTCLRVLTGAARPDAGRLSLEGRDVTDASTQERARAGVVRTLQHTAVFSELTALQHVMAGTVAHRAYGGALRTTLSTPLARMEEGREQVLAEAALALVGLIGARDEQVFRLSQGEQRLLIVATALVSNPKVLLLDEPSAGMGREEADRLASVLANQREQGIALLIVEHNLRLIARLAEQVTVLDAGRVIAEGSPREVAADPRVREVYLGSARL